MPMSLATAHTANQPTLMPDKKIAQSLTSFSPHNAQTLSMKSVVSSTHRGGAASKSATARVKSAPSHFSVRVRSAKLVLDDGQSFTLTVPIIIGRRPVANPSYPSAMLVALTDKTKCLSKTHILVYVQNGAVKVRDLNSRNGVRIETKETVVTVPSGAEMEVPSNARVCIGGRSFVVVVHEKMAASHK